MLKISIVIALHALAVSIGSKAQILKQEAFIDSITASHIVLKMFDDEIRSLGKVGCFTRGWRCADFCHTYVIGTTTYFFNGKGI